MTSQFQRRHEMRAGKCAKISSHPMGDWDPFPNGPLGEVGGVSVLDTLIAGYNPSAGRGLLAGRDYTLKLGCLCLKFWKGTGHIEVTIKDVDMTKPEQMAGIAAVTSACTYALISGTLPGTCSKLAQAECQAAAHLAFPNSSPTSKMTGC